MLVHTIILKLKNWVMVKLLEQKMYIQNQTKITLEQ